MRYKNQVIGKHRYLFDLIEFGIGITLEHDKKIKDV